MLLCWDCTFNPNLALGPCQLPPNKSWHIWWCSLCTFATDQNIPSIIHLFFGEEDRITLEMQHGNRRSFVLSSNKRFGHECWPHQQKKRSDRETLAIYFCLCYSQYVYKLDLQWALLWRNSSALVIQCVLTLLLSLFLWISWISHHGTILAICSTRSGASEVYFIVLPRATHFVNEAVALWTLGLCKLCISLMYQARGPPLFIVYHWTTPKASS